jgi:Phosphotransferase enzyme family
VNHKVGSESACTPESARWRAGLIELQAGQIVSHGDLGPWNSVWNNETLVGLIDWEFAEPRWPVEDVAEVAWYFVPLQGPGVWREAGFTETPPFGRRLSVLCEAYGGFMVEEVVDALIQRQQLERRRTLELGGSGVSPWARFLAPRAMSLSSTRNTRG